MFYNLVVILTWSWEEVSTALTYSVILTGTPGVFVLCWFSLGLTALLEPDQVSFRALFTPLSALLPHCLGKLWISRYKSIASRGGWRLSTRELGVNQHPSVGRCKPKSSTCSAPPVLWRAKVSASSYDQPILSHGFYKAVLWYNGKNMRFGFDCHFFKAEWSTTSHFHFLSLTCLCCKVRIIIIIISSLTSVLKINSSVGYKALHKCYIADLWVILLFHRSWLYVRTLVNFSWLL